jgi:hypothetical protein
MDDGWILAVGVSGLCSRLCESLWRGADRTKHADAGGKTHHGGSPGYARESSDAHIGQYDDAEHFEKYA